MATKRSQPKWSADSEGGRPPVLKLFNSLTRQKEEFVPRKGKRVVWYSCGPTVYDASHMGHARSYITFDILRRVLSDYFGYKIFFVMNVTDIDDKIIKRARQQHLYKQYLAEESDLVQTLSDAKAAMNQLMETTKTVEDPDKKNMLLKMLDKMSAAVLFLEESVKSNDDSKIEAAKKRLLEEAKDPISDWLDSRLGADITDNSIFTELPRHWENEFRKDLKALNIQEPNVWCRVSEYIPEIIEFINEIIKNGYAYESKGSVYFDVMEFDKRPNHYYAKLVPESYGDSSQLLTGEGELSSKDTAEKRAVTDFALWKKSKPGEPWWESPWGRGRPGWHIECSAMASDICGHSLDIHTGGVDLKFPHHDNELAQSEAYFDNDQWVRYFLHSGHLTISGCKMSKSLKNFVSISEAMKKHTARQLRIAFLLHSWKETLDYSESTMEMAIAYERMLNEFFLNVKDIVRNNKTSDMNDFEISRWRKTDTDLEQKFTAMNEGIHNALCDNVDTRTALEQIKECIGHCNIYIRKGQVNPKLLEDIAVNITKVMRMFGTINDGLDSEIGFPVMASSSAAQGNVETVLMPYLKIISNFRDEVRSHARQVKATDILKACDALRDDILPNVGVRLEDGPEGQPTAVKFVDKEQLLREKEAKKKQELEKAAEKERKRKEQEELQAKKDAEKRIPPSEMFRAQTDKYSKFDDQGIPTHDNEGKEVSKGQQKKLLKLWQAQEKKYNEYISSLKQNGIKEQ
ncbi:cysteine--tRNA ligase, cytoplasmic isoform X3 [Nilaparvata lugens]|nr:cysteine--tRNA ligase, cytoplasmic isoform X3 [Nilaparvata lugens]